MASAAAKLRHSFLAFPKILYLVLLIILCIVFADIKNSPPTFNSSEAQILEDIFTNVHTNPITTIQTITTGTCPEGSTKLVLGTWQGTYEGCSCANSLTIGACSSDQSGCTTIPAVSPKEITTWSGSQFCVTRLSSFSLPDSTDACPTTGNTQFCKNSKLCIPAAETCPVNIIKRVATGSEVPEGYTSVTLNSTFNIIYANNEPATNAISQIAVSLYDMPCMNPNTMPYTTDKKPYALSRVPETNCNGTGTVDYLIRVERKDITTVFGENSLSTTVSALPGFADFILDQDAYLVGLKQYKLMTTPGLSCGPADPAIFPDVISREDNFVSLANGVLIAALVIQSIVFFTIIIEFAFRIRGNQEEEKYTLCFWYINLGLTLIACILFIVVGANAINAKVKLSKNVGYFNYLAKYSCFEEQDVNLLLKIYQGNISNFYAMIWLNIVLLILSSVGILVTVILAVINMYAGGRSGDASYYKRIGGMGKRKKNGGYRNNNIELSHAL